MNRISRMNASNAKLYQSFCKSLRIYTILPQFILKILILARKIRINMQRFSFHVLRVSTKHTPSPILSFIMCEHTAHGFQRMQKMSRAKVARKRFVLRLPICIMHIHVLHRRIMRIYYRGSSKVHDNLWPQILT